MELKNNAQTSALKKLDELRERLYLEGEQTRDSKILLIAQEIGEIEIMFQNERKQNPENVVQIKGGFITNYCIDVLDKGFSGGQLGL